MNILLTNDDGVDAPGLAALAAAIESPVTIIAPRDPMSECSHRVTTKHAIAVERRSPYQYAVAGTPADCVRVGLKQLLPQVDWVLSGINDGGNLGSDIYISGTVAAAREAAFHGIPAIAFSQYRKGQSGQTADWGRATPWAANIFMLLRQRPGALGTLWNVNLPALLPGDPEPQIIFCERSRHPLPVKYQQQGESLLYAGNYHTRTYEPGTDVDVCFSGNIAITLIQI